MKKNDVWFSLVEIVISIIILSIFLIWAYNAVHNFYNTVHYIDSHLNGLNISKNAIDEVVHLRNEYVKKYPLDGWERFMWDFWSWTYIIVSDNNTISLSWILDQTSQYEWPLNIFWKSVQEKEWIYFLRKLDIEEENNFYLKNIHRTQFQTWELLQFIFSDTIYNSQSFVIISEFDNQNFEITSENINVDFYNLNWESSSNGVLLNINNQNLKYSKVVSYWENIEDGWYFQINSNEQLVKKIIFYKDEIPYIDDTTKQMPLKIYDDINLNYYNLCKEIDNIDSLSCSFQYLIRENFYQKIFWIDEKKGEIYFWEDFHFTMTGAKQNEIQVWVSHGVLPEKDNFFFINPFYEMKHNTTSKNYDILGLVWDSTSWLGVGLPERKPIGIVSTSTGYTSLIQVKVTTFLYDTNKFIDSYEIDTKLWDIFRYQFNYEN